MDGPHSAGAIAAVAQTARGKTAARTLGKPFSARRAARKATPLTLVLSTAVGFVAGALFWHAVGFWSFVNEAVFYTRADGAAPVPASRIAGATSSARSMVSPSPPKPFMMMS